MVALSVSMSAMTSPAETLAPASTFHSAMLPCVIVGDSAGMVISWNGGSAAAQRSVGCGVFSSCAFVFATWGNGEVGSASRGDWRVKKTRCVHFGKAKRRASGKNIFTMARGRFGPRRARRGDATRSAGSRSRPTFIARKWLGGRKEGDAHSAAAANDRPPFQHAALRVIGANLRALEAEHTARHPASGRFNDRGAAIAHGAADAARLSAFRSAIDTRSRPRTAQAVR